MSKILFSYKESRFTLKVSSNDIASYAEYSYDRECRHSNDPEYECDHEYSRCQVLENIRFDTFNKFSFVKDKLVSLKKSDGDLLPEVRELVCRAISGIDFIAYFDAKAESDYYGETLEVTVTDLQELIDRIVINLKIEGMRDIDVQ